MKYKHIVNDKTLFETNDVDEFIKYITKDPIGKNILNYVLAKSLLANENLTIRM
jgi:hypothetical protein